MNDLIVRPYQPGDVRAVTALTNVIIGHAGGRSGMTIDDTASFVSGAVRDVAADSRLVFTPGGDLVAAALVGTPPAGGYRMDTAGGVHPAWRGRGLGRRLLAWQLDRARQIHRETAPDVDWSVHFDVWQGDVDTPRLFARFGLTAVRSWYTMAARPRPATTLSPPEGLVVRPYTPDREAEVYAAHMDAFTDHWGFQPRGFDEWAARTVRAAGFVPGLSLLGYAGTDLAGYLLSYQGDDPEALYIGHLGVRRPWRWRGLAAALLVAVLSAAGAEGRQRVTLTVDADNPSGAVGLYERVGFTVESRTITYAASLPAAT